jgi:hypothetical protein
MPWSSPVQFFPGFIRGLLGHLLSRAQKFSLAEPALEQDVRMLCHLAPNEGLMYTYDGITISLKNEGHPACDTR